jgi:hypothetical protein
MYMEAIRLSLASAEEDRRKQEKEEAKKAKKEEKQKAKDAKKAAKEAKKSASGGGMYLASMNGSEANGFNGAESSTAAGTAAATGKGKAPASSGSDRSPASNLEASPKAPKDDPQAFLEQSRANIQSAPVSVPTPSQHLSSTTPPHRQASRHLSSASSVSSLNDSQEASPNTSGLHLDQTSTAGPYSETPPGGGAGTEPMFNFRSLAAVIGDEEDGKGGAAIEHLEHAQNKPSLPSPLGIGITKNGESSSPPKVSGTITPPERPLSAGERLFGVVSPSSPPASSPPRGGVGIGLGTVRELSSSPKTVTSARQEIGDEEDGGILTPHESNPYDAKHYGDISILDTTGPFSSAR